MHKFKVSALLPTQTLLIALLGLLVISTSTQAAVLIPAPPEISAKSWILIDANTGVGISNR